ncbi:GNAT family N-acetyltransferase [Thermoflavimicrobium daqui]|jgi:predicted N-acyltransferase|uniref:BioF2-like acetyltransferase domain-containing protein n=1 Tax=Thermoflavimicrobium daqui TaxID=2137476 RepID=A0A364K4E0_9BACL|nr:GNAT family N-acetyltransferase [Thermoflavimicrobium daqui]RAL24235.1 hypothetical protein DL897_11185 [Thermoflavimicrobium daqui]
MMWEVEVLESLSSVKSEEWNTVIDEANASVFYRHELLYAYEKKPLQPVERFVYVVVREVESGKCVAVLPSYLVRWSDPLGVLSQAVRVPEGEEAPILLTHFWYCYDTRLPASYLSKPLVQLITDVMAETAREYGAKWSGFVNVADSEQLIPMLEAAGHVAVQTETRYILDLSQFTTMDEYLSSLRSRPRKNLLRYVRKAREEGVTFTDHVPPFAMTTEVAALCHGIARKHKNDGYYPYVELEHFLRTAGDSLRILGVNLKDRLIATSICLQDQTCFHTWAGGADYSAKTSFAANYVLFYREVEAAISSGKKIMEAGRRNADFKLRYGMQPIHLYACIRHV